MPAHKVNSWQVELLLAAGALFLVEVLRGSLHLSDSVLNDVVVLDELVYLVIVLLNSVNLLLELGLQE